jgi:hypothetical protein
MKCTWCYALAIALCFCTITGSAQTDTLVANFKQPKASAKPMVWWFWGESVTTKHGITKDLEALKQAGFGGVVLYEQVFKDNPGALKSLSPEWLEQVRFAAAECARLGLRLEINAGNGYVAGGPWITPELGMQRLVYSEMKVSGGQRLSVTLPQPPTKLGYYKEVAVLAFPSVAPGELPAPAVSGTPVIADVATLFKPNETRRVRIKGAPGNQHASITLDYGRSVTLRSLTYGLRPGSKALIIATEVPGNWSKDFYGEGMQPILPIGELEASNDKVHWQVLRTLPGRGYQFENYDRQTVSFPAKTARYFRLNLHGWGHNERSHDDDLLISGISLQQAAKIDQWEEKSGNTNDFPNPDRTPAYKGTEVIDPSRIINLTKLVSADGRLDWNAPPGEWTILRFGHTPTGAKTKHGRPEGLGLECDKLSADAARIQFENYVGKILAEIRTVPGAKLAGVNMDSDEQGIENWTGQFPAEFLQRCGYDVYRFLPAMAGYVVGSPEQSDRFLYDIRRTIANLLSDAYYGTFQQLCKAEGMTFMAQAPGIATCMPSDNIRAKGRTDIPMGEFWMTQHNGTMDCKEAASAAHVYGMPIAAAESFTGSKADVTLAQMKPLADAALALGINRFVVLAYMHQPWDDRKPGVTEDRFYLPYQRHNTWWNYSAGFWNTLSRSSQMMQSGMPVMDLLYHLGNDVPLKIAPWRMRPIPPAGYDYDVCSDEILLRTTVKDGRIVLSGGMSYKALVLAGGNRISLAAAKHIRDLIKAGAIVIGNEKFIASPSLADGATGNQQVKEIGNVLWGRGKLTASGSRTFDKGKIVWGYTPGQVLAGLHLDKDFEVISPKKTPILYMHRRAGDDDIYFVANHSDEPVSCTAAFRVSGRFPQAWNPENGNITALPGYKQDKERTEVPVSLEPNSSLFVVFRKQPANGAPPALVEAIPVWKTLDSAWTVAFDPGGGAPEKVVFPHLISWTDAADSGIKNYSGTATYKQSIDLTSIPSGHVWLDLGRVEVVASVCVNGHECGALWKKPYAVDITGFLQRGENEIEIKVANVWTNRLIADAGLPAADRISWETFNPYKPTDKRLPSGLLGPVSLRVKR